MTKRYLILTAVALIGAATATARQLTPDEALNRALAAEPTVMSSQSRTSVAPSLCFTAGEDGLNTLYVFDRGNQAGFIVVSADDSSGPALLGYSDSGTAPTEAHMPANLRWWLGQYSREIAAGVLNGDGSDETAGEYPQTDPVEPLCQTYWNQTSPYNALCPKIDGVNCPTGCIATAMAQAMMVYRWPEKGQGVHAYKPIAIGEMLTVDFSNSTYQWDKMLDRYTASSAQENIDAVARLMYDCGVSISMQYEANSSGGNYTNAAKSLVKYFNYDKGLRILDRDYYGIMEWINMIIAELQAGHPVLYSGRNDEAGHAFVCDGYRGDGYFHINWGWGGTSNGYFLLSALEPSEQGVGGSAAGYNIGQTALIGLQKPVEGSTIVPVFKFISNFSTAEPSYSVPYGEVKFMDRRGIFNESIDSLHATMGVKLTDADGNVSYVESTEKKYLSGQGFTNYYIPVQRFPKTGSYVVTPVVKGEDGKWHDAEVKLSNVGSLNLTIGTDSLRFAAGKVASVVATDVELLSPIYPGRQCGVRATLTNNSDLDFYEEVVPVLVFDGEEKAQATPIAVELLPGESNQFEWLGEFPSTLAPGTYKLYLVDKSGNDISRGVTVTVEAAPTVADKYTFTSTTVGGAGAESTVSTPVEISYSDFAVRVTVRCESGYFSGVVGGGVYPTDRESGIKGIEGKYIAVREGEEGSVELHADLSEYLATGTVYYFLAESGPSGRTGNNLYFTSTTSGIDIIGEDSDDVSVGPNPADDYAVVTAKETITAVDVYSMSGVKVAGVAGVSLTEVEIEVAPLPRGLYLVAVTTADGRRSVAKLIRR